MKKFLIGCGVLFGLFCLFMGGLIYFGANAVKGIAGDMMKASEIAMNMPTDRMEQDAISLAPDKVAPRLPELLNQPVKVSGTVADLAKRMPKGSYQPPAQPGAPNTQLFIEPGIMIVPGPGAAIPVGNVEGRTVEVLGIMTRMQFGNMPGMTDDARKQLQDAFGSTDMPVVIARRVELVVGNK